jgi:hypothetical protein
MLVLSLFCTCLLLLGTNLSMWQRSIVTAFVQCLLWLVCPMFLMLILPTHLKITLGLGVLVMLGSCFRWPTRYFLPLSLSLAAGVYTWQIVSVHQENARMVAEFPLIKLAERLPVRPPWDAEPVLLPVAQDRLRQRENDLEDETKTVETQSRVRMFRQLHEESTRMFASNPGFGVMRMPLVITEWSLRRAMEKKDVPEQTSTSRPVSPSPSAWNVILTEQAPASMDALHTRGQHEFLKPERFGYVKNRQQVAGFLSHQFNEPLPAGTLTMQRLDLISLLLHEQPVAYVTNQLPKMEELRAAPTRPLELFESTALQALQRGDDLVVNESGDTIWLLGALRATKQCLECHDVKRGQLLGAFSYVLKNPASAAGRFEPSKSALSP